MKILEDLWYGQISPYAMKNNHSEEFLELVDLYARNEEHLLSTFTQEQKEDWKKIEYIWEDMERIAECNAFVTGFRLAVQLMAASV